MTASQANALSDQDCLPTSLPTLLSMTIFSTEVKEFAIVPLHAAPLDAVAEIDSLYEVYLDVRKKWDIEVRPHTLD